MLILPTRSDQSRFRPPPTITPAPVPAPDGVVNEEALFYMSLFGGMGDGGGYTEPDSEPLGFFGSIGVTLQFQPWKYFAVESGMIGGFPSDEASSEILAFPIMGKLTFRPDIFYMDVGAGYILGVLGPSGMGFTSSLGMELGGGGLFFGFFVQYTGLVSEETFANFGFAGFKIGIGW